MAAEVGRLVLDISRTIARARLSTPSGIDRVERAYIRWVAEREGLFSGRIGGTTYLCARETVDALCAWLDGDGPAPSLDLEGYLRMARDPRLRRAQALIRRAAQASATGPEATAQMLRRAAPGGGVYLNCGHDNLDQGDFAAIAAAGLRTAVFLHDTIPLDHPEFARPGTPERFRGKLRAAGAADLLLVNSAHTAGRVAALTGRADAIVAPLGIDPVQAAPARTGPPRFVCLGTIEPRKNHRLLLDVWARFWADRPADRQPHLHIIGRRGWQNHDVFRILDTAPFVGRTVFEHAGQTDADLAVQLSGARALLFPSLAEGYGLPLAEALAAGVPVVASDLPALREVGGNVPDWLPPDLPERWGAAIDDYAAEPSAPRCAQLERIRDWQPPQWSAHFAIVRNALETILAQNGTAR